MLESSSLRAGGMGAFKSGPPGHYSIRPVSADDMAEWLQSRANATFETNPFTNFLQSIVQQVKNR